jgi:ribosomal protein L29
MPTSAPSRRVRSEVANLVREQLRQPDDEQLAIQIEDRRREYRYLRAQDYIRELVDSAPPLTDAQRDRLALLLRGDS